MNLTPTTFDLENARECAALSRVAYETYTLTDEATDTQVWVRIHDDRVEVAFRGTNDQRKFLTDAEFFRHALYRAGHKVAEVHAGFLLAHEGIIPKLMQFLWSQGADKLPTFVTGHSLGGALAVLAALELSWQKFPVEQVYTFGQPRVGNCAFANLYDTEPVYTQGRGWTTLGEITFRVVYEEDIVARVPHLPGLLDPYRHAGVEVFLPSGCESPVLNPGFGTLLRSDLRGIWRAWRARGVAGLLTDLLTDHHMNNYVRRLATHNTVRRFA